jgi:uncharacterized membrane protein HdeD (DUF308 family)
MDGINNLLARNWWLIVLRGIAALIFGLLTIFYPGVSLTVLVLFFGAYALIGGLFMIAAAISNRRGEPHWPSLLLSGIISVAIGVVTFFMPVLTGLALLYLIGVWAILTGIAEVATAIRLRKVMTGEWMLILAGVLSVTFGVILFVFPRAGALALALWIGVYAVVFGVLLIALGIRLRGWGRRDVAGGRVSTA